jgi:trypsin
VGSTRIIGGTELEEDSAPYSVSLMSLGSHFCGGSLITDRVVLTAAHCLGDSISVVIGRHDFDDRDGEVIFVSKQIPHPDYNDNTSEYDMGLLVLSKPVKNAVQAVTVHEDSSFPSKGTPARVMGWGNRVTSGFQLPDVPYMADLEVISNQQCEDFEKRGDSYGDLKYSITDDMLCTYTEKKDACQGDSGGPLIIKGNDASQDVLVGVVSWGIGCAYLPGVYGRVSKAYDWIKEEACAVSDDTTGSTFCGTRQPSLSPTTAEPTVTPSENPTSVP